MLKGAHQSQRGKEASMPHEAEMAHKIKEALAADERTSTVEVHIKMVGDVAFLDGHAESEEQKQAASEVAKTVEGVRFVQNRLHVGAEHRTMREVMKEQHH
jgi:osmotically-inducible protein OsmY